MPLVSLSPEPILRFVGNDNLPLVGGQLFTYQAGTNTLYPTYTDSTGQYQHENPIQLNSRGEVATASGISAGLWIPSGVAYTYVLRDAQNNQIWALPNLSDGSANILDLITSVLISSRLDSLKITDAERNAGIVPVNLAWDPGDLRRYGGRSGANSYSAFTTALLANPVVYCEPGATYLMEQQLQPPGDRIIEMNGATISRTFDSLPSGTLGMIALNESGNFTLRNGTLNGNRALMSASEFKHNIEILGCDNVSLENIVSIDPMGDGVYVGYDTTNTLYSTNITLRNVKCVHAYRNGLSITGVDTFDAFGCEFTQTSGTAPNSGVDIEANSTTQVTRNITFHGCSANGNFADGFQVAFVFQFDDSAQRNVDFHGCTANGNGNVGFHAYRSTAVSWHGGECRNNGADGARISAEANGVALIGTDLSFNGRRGFYIAPEGGGFARNLMVDHCTILNNSQSASGTYEGIRAEGIGSTIGLTVTGSTISFNHNFAVSTSVNVSRVRILSNDLFNNVVSAANLSDDIDTRQVGFNDGYVTHTWGNEIVADGGTITHGVADTPTSIVVSASVSGEFASVTARSATTFTLAIKKNDGSAGTTQTIYYSAEL